MVHRGGLESSAEKNKKDDFNSCIAENAKTADDDISNNKIEESAPKAKQNKKSAKKVSPKSTTLPLSDHSISQTVVRLERSRLIKAKSNTNSKTIDTNIGSKSKGVSPVRAGLRSSSLESHTSTTSNNNNAKAKKKKTNTKIDKKTDDAECTTKQVSGQDLKNAQQPKLSKKLPLSLICSLPLNRLSGILDKIKTDKTKCVLNAEEDTSPSSEDKSNVDKNSNQCKTLCLYCDKRMSTVKVRARHIERFHTISKERRSSSRNPIIPSSKDTKDLTGTPTACSSSSAPSTPLSSTTNLFFTGCSYCSKSPKLQAVALENDLSALFFHLVDFHSDKYFGCKICAIRFQTVAKLNDHVHRNHPSSEKNSIPVTEDVKTSLVSGEEERASSEFEKSTPTKTRRQVKQIGTESLLPTATQGAVPSSSMGNRNGSMFSNDEPILSRLGLTQNRLPRGRKGIRSRRQTNVDSVKPDTSLIAVKTRSKLGRFNTSNEPVETVFRTPTNTRIEPLSCTFDEDFYEKVFNNVRTNLSCHLDGKIGSDSDTHRPQSPPPLMPAIRSTVVKSPQVLESEVHTATSLAALTAFPTLLTAEQYGCDFGSSKIKRPITRHSWKWKWDSVKKYKYVNEGGKIVKKIKQPMLGLRDLSKLDMWTQLTMRQKHEVVRKQSEANAQSLVESTDTSREEKQRQVDQLNTILDSRLLPQIILEQNEQTVIKLEITEEGFRYLASEASSPVSPTKDEAPSTSQAIDRIIPANLNLIPSRSRGESLSQSVVLSGEWARPRCYVCFGCGARFDKRKALEEHKMFRHPHVYSTHYEIVGRELIEGNLYKHFFIPLKALSRHREYAQRILVNKKTDYNVSKSSSNSGNEEESLDSLHSVTASFTTLSSSKLSDDCDTDTKTAIENVSSFTEPLSPILGKNDTNSSVATCSSSMDCTKCNRNCHGILELYRHMLDCSGDYAWILAKKKKYRYYGSRKRRQFNRQNISALHLHRRKVKASKDENESDETPKKKYMSPSTPRPRASDADSIRKMLENLPAKRVCREIIPNATKPRTRKFKTTASGRKIQQKSSKNCKSSNKTLTAISKKILRNHKLRAISEKDKISRSKKILETKRKSARVKSRLMASKNVHSQSSKGNKKTETRRGGIVRKIGATTKRFVTKIKKRLLGDKSGNTGAKNDKTKPTEEEKKPSKMSAVRKLTFEKENETAAPTATEEVKCSPEKPSITVNCATPETSKHDSKIEKPNLSPKRDKCQVPTITVETNFEPKKTQDTSLNEDLSLSLRSEGSTENLNEQQSDISASTEDLHRLNSGFLHNQVSPTTKRRSKKINDCIAMLTGKIQEKLGKPFLECKETQSVAEKDKSPQNNKESCKALLSAEIKETKPTKRKALTRKIVKCDQSSEATVEQVVPESKPVKVPEIPLQIESIIEKISSKGSSIKQPQLQMKQLKESLDKEPAISGKLLEKPSLDNKTSSEIVSKCVPVASSLPKETQAKVSKLLTEKPVSSTSCEIPTLTTPKSNEVPFVMPTLKNPPFKDSNLKEPYLKESLLKESPLKNLPKELQIKTVLKEATLKDAFLKETSLQPFRPPFEDLPTNSSISVNENSHRKEASENRKTSISGYQSSGVLSTAQLSGPFNADLRPPKDVPPSFTNFKPVPVNRIPPPPVTIEIVTPDPIMLNENVPKKQTKQLTAFQQCVINADTIRVPNVKPPPQLSIPQFMPLQQPVPAPRGMITKRRQTIAGAPNDFLYDMTSLRCGNAYNNLPFELEVPLDLSKKPKRTSPKAKQTTTKDQQPVRLPQISVKPNAVLMPPVPYQLPILPQTQIIPIICEPLHPNAPQISLQNPSLVFPKEIAAKPSTSSPRKRMTNSKKGDSIININPTIVNITVDAPPPKKVSKKISKASTSTPAIWTPTINTPPTSSTSVSMPSVSTPPTSSPSVSTSLASTEPASTPTASTGSASACMVSASTPLVNTPLASTPLTNTPSASTPSPNTPSASTPSARTLSESTPLITSTPSISTSTKISSLMSTLSTSMASTNTVLSNTVPRSMVSTSLPSTSMLPASTTSTTTTTISARKVSTSTSMTNTPLNSTPVLSSPLEIAPLTNTITASLSMTSTPKPSTKLSSTISLITTTPPTSTPLGNTSVISAPLISTSLVSTPLVSTPLVSTPLVSTSLVSTSLPSTSLSCAPLPSTTHTNTPLASIPLATSLMPSSSSASAATVKEKLELDLVPSTTEANKVIKESNASKSTQLNNTPSVKDAVIIPEAKTNRLEEALKDVANPIEITMEVQSNNTERTKEVLLSGEVNPEKSSVIISTSLSDMTQPKSEQTPKAELERKISKVDLKETKKPKANKTPIQLTTNKKDPSSSNTTLANNQATAETLNKKECKNESSVEPQKVLPTRRSTRNKVTEQTDECKPTSLNKTVSALKVVEEIAASFISEDELENEVNDLPSNKKPQCDVTPKKSVKESTKQKEETNNEIFATTKTESFPNLSQNIEENIELTDENDGVSVANNTESEPATNKQKSGKKPRRRRKNELASIVADQLMESFKETDKSRIDDLKRLEELAYEKSEDLLLTGMRLMPTTKRKNVLENKKDLSAELEPKGVNSVKETKKQKAESVKEKSSAIQKEDTESKVKPDLPKEKERGKDKTKERVNEKEKGDEVESDLPKEKDKNKISNVQKNDMELRKDAQNVQKVEMKVKNQIEPSASSNNSTPIPKDPKMKPLPLDFANYRSNSVDSWSIRGLKQKNAEQISPLTDKSPNSDILLLGQKEKKNKKKQTKKRDKKIEIENINQLRTGLESFTLSKDVVDNGNENTPGSLVVPVSEQSHSIVGLFTSTPTQAQQISTDGAILYKDTSSFGSFSHVKSSSSILRPSILGASLDIVASNKENPQQSVDRKSNISSRDPRLNKNIHTEEGDQVSVPPETTSRLATLRTRRKSFADATPPTYASRANSRSTTSKRSIGGSRRNSLAFDDDEDDNYLTAIAKRVNDKIMSAEDKDFNLANDGFELASSFLDQEDPFGRPSTSMSVRSAPNFNEDRSNMDTMDATNTDLIDMDVDDDMSVYTTFSQDTTRSKGGRRRRRRRSVLLTRKPKKTNVNMLDSMQTFDCLLCNKKFAKAVALNKHQLTIAHVSKVSEQEYLNAKRKEEEEKSEKSEKSEKQIQSKEVKEGVCISKSTTATPCLAPSVVESPKQYFNAIQNIRQEENNIASLKTSETQGKVLAEKVKRSHQPKVPFIPPNSVLNQSGIEPISSPEQNYERYSTKTSSRLTLNPDERLFYECCNILKGSETPLVERSYPIVPPTTYAYDLQVKPVTPKSPNERFAYMKQSTSETNGKRESANYPRLDVNQFSDISSDSNPACAQPPPVLPVNYAQMHVLSGAKNQPFLTTDGSGGNVPSRNNLPRESSILQMASIATPNLITPTPLTARTFVNQPSQIGTHLHGMENLAAGGQKQNFISPMHSASSQSSTVTTTTCRPKTKAAMKGYDNLKVSIPTIGLDMEHALERSPRPGCRLTTLADIALGNETPLATFTPSLQMHNDQKCKGKQKPANNEAAQHFPSILQSQTKEVQESTIKKIENSPVKECSLVISVHDTESCMPIVLSSPKKSESAIPKDVYEFDDSENTPISKAIQSPFKISEENESVPKKAIIIPERPFKNIGMEEKEAIKFQKPETPAINDENTNSTVTYSDRDDFVYGSMSGGDDDNDNDNDDNKETHVESEESSNSSAFTAKTFENKSLIMGRIFKNAKTKPKIAAEKSTLPTPEPPKQIPKQELDRLFDTLRGVNENRQNAKEERPENVPNSSRKRETQSVKGKQTVTPKTSKSKSTANKQNKKVTKKNEEQSSKELSQLHAELGMSPAEIAELIGEGQRKSQRRCAVNRPKKLVEIWSSDEFEEFLSTKDIIALIEEKEQQKTKKKRKTTSTCAARKFNTTSAANKSIKKYDDEQSVTQSEDEKSQSCPATPKKTLKFSTPETPKAAKVTNSIKNTKTAKAKKKVLPATTNTSTAPPEPKVTARPTRETKPISRSRNSLESTKNNGSPFKKPTQKNIISKHTADDSESDFEAELNRRTRAAGSIRNRRKTISGKLENDAGSSSSSTKKLSAKSKSEKPDARNSSSKTKTSQPTSADSSQTRPQARRKRIASEMLYYWSSSSDEEFGRIESPHDDEHHIEESENYQQHGWIVGDSHKKLVTLLAIAKGNKKVDDCGVKETNSKKKS